MGRRQVEVKQVNATTLVGQVAFLLCCCSVTIAQTIDEANLDARGERPNIIVILADDMGYSDLGCTGAEIDTPNLDGLARDGLLFTHCYNTSRCCPTRAALLTGQYQWDAGMGHMTYLKTTLPEYSVQLNRECATIAELLGQAGYQTFMAGKWHLGDKREFWPDRRGFQRFYGTPQGGGIYFYPSRFYKRPIFRDGTQVKPEGVWYSTDAFTDATIDYLKSERDGNRPFFVYLAYIAPHFPLQAKESDIAKYEKTYTVGYEAIRRGRHQKQQRLGIVPEGLPMSTAAYDWDEVSDKELEARKMAVYAAQVDCLDQNIGKLIKTLQSEGIAENTMILFLSDNGGARSKFNKTPDAIIGSPDCNAAYGKWYNVSNTPYRQGKNQEHEGGIITPMVVRWPARIKRPGRLVHAPMHVMDVMPTCLKLAGTHYPGQFGGNPLDPLDGADFLPLMEGVRQDPDRILYWEHEGNRAVRRGHWKLVSLHKKRWELYDLSVDPYEVNDLTDQHPKRVAELKRLYKHWAAEHGVQPWPLTKNTSR
ncbi:MAG: arylsulfatase [Pirellulaceae bacterium]|nr:arylsulfatase [Pirellulaceae bacterium]